MLKAHHHWIYVKFFNWYLKMRINQHFHDIKIIGNISKPDAATIMIGNHISWWDGFIAQYLNLQFLQKKIFIMMLEEELQKRRFFCKTGAFSINKTKSGIVESLNYSTEILQKKENLLLMYPQGLIKSQHLHQLQFNSGIEKIVKQASYPLQLCFYAALTDYFSNPKPTLFLYIQDFTLQNPETVSNIEKKYNNFLSNCLHQQSLLPC